MKEKKSFSASLEHLHEILSWICSRAGEFKFGTSDLYKIELACEEAIVNVINHSYKNRRGVVTIAIDRKGGLFSVSVIDSGKAFNPLTRNVTIKETDLRRRSIGGLGLIFIRYCMDEVRYERKNNQNILTLIKHNGESDD
jgi:serine/threonine-protein kinase RsbW